MISLKDGHIWFDHELVSFLFGEEEHVNMVYYDERKELLLASRTKTFFEKLHKTIWTALKIRTIKGDKTISIRNLLIDHDLDESDRNLKYDIKTTGIISISFA